MKIQDIAELFGLFIFVALAIAGIFEAWDMIVALLGRLG